MKFLGRDSETICAIATAPGVGAIGVIRVSGRKSFLYTEKITKSFPKNPESHRCYYVKITNPKNEIIDDVLLTLFEKGRSYTGEESTEISFHGSPVIGQSILDELILAGCKLAEPGEFTFRAFMNQRIDLVQAESVLATIESQSKVAARAAHRSLEGELSKEFSKIEDSLVWILANVEASIDFSTEDIETFDRKESLQKLQAIKSRVDELVESFVAGKKVIEGLRIAICGQVNVGKSSLLNELCSQRKSIVTDVPGTTRDLVETLIDRRGVLLKLIDTAGLRVTDDQVEKIGIERGREAVEESDIALYVFDLSRPSNESEIKGLKTLLNTKPVLVVLNKSDISIFENLNDFWSNFDEEARHKIGQFAQLPVQLGSQSSQADELQAGQSGHLGDSKNGQLGHLAVCEGGQNGQSDHMQAAGVVISASQSHGLDNLWSILDTQIDHFKEKMGGQVVTPRQFDYLLGIQKGLVAAIQQVEDGVLDSPDLIAFELQDAILAIHKLLGKEYDDQVMDRVFSGFCIGK